MAVNQPLPHIARRIDMAGEREQPLTIQLAGASDDLTECLLANGWLRPPSLTLKNFLGMLFPDTPVEKLPVLPRLHVGRIDRLRLMVRRVDSQLWILRLWPTDVKTSTNDTPIFVGTIEVQNKHHRAGLITMAGDTGEYDRPLDALKQLLHERFAMKLVSRTGDEIQIDRKDRRLHWRDRVLLLW